MIFYILLLIAALWFHFSVVTWGEGFLLYFATYYFSEIAFYFPSPFILTILFFLPFALSPSF